MNVHHIMVAFHFVATLCHWYWLGTFLFYKIPDTGLHLLPDDHLDEEMVALKKLMEKVRRQRRQGIVFNITSLLFNFLCLIKHMN